MTAVSGTIDERIRQWLGQGFRLTVQTATTAQLVRPRRFNPAEFLAMPLYVIEYLGQREQVVYLAEKDGVVDETTVGMERSAYRRAQERSGLQRLLIVLVGGAVVLVALWAINSAGR